MPTLPGILNLLAAVSFSRKKQRVGIAEIRHQLTLLSVGVTDRLTQATLYSINEYRQKFLGKVFGLKGGKARNGNWCCEMV